jgi:hypothetical protein
MKLVKFLVIILALIQFPSYATSIEYTLDFGRIIHNEIGEPIGFEKTNQIPILKDGESSLYGLVITSPETTEFLLNSIHIFPKSSVTNTNNKMMGKPMLVQKRGAILLRTDTGDEPGKYAMEIYIDSKLHQVISYELISPQNLTRL